MSYGRSKKDNEYARALLDIDAPKTVWMAIAFADIVPQKPRRG